MIGERLSPILVKELRQGMRARAFEGSFLLLQVLMVFAIVIALLALTVEQAGSSSRMFGETMFWIMVAIPVLLIMPMRGCNALRTEIDAKSLELIFLTRLSAWRIVVGKWAALFSQTCLLVIAVLPYAVLRYYLGSIDVIAELLVIGAMLGASALLTAFTVSCSAFSSKLARGMIFVFPIVLLNVAPILVAWAMAARFGYYVSSPHLGPGIYGAYLFYGGVTLLYLLEIGAGQIAPPAENHAVRKRLLGLVVLVSGPVAVWLGADPEILIAHFVLVLVVCVDAICGRWHAVPGVYLPLFRLGPVGRAFANLFVPGWPSGMLYSVVVLASFYPMILMIGSVDDELFLLYIATVSTLFMPMAIVRLFFPRTQRLGTVYWSIQLILFILTMLTLVLDGAFGLDVEWFFGVVPVGAFVLVAKDSTASSWLPASAAVLIASLAVILVRSIGPWKQLRDLKKEARRLYGVQTTQAAAASSESREAAETPQ